MKPRKKLGALLLEAGLIDEEQLQAALDHQKHWGGRLGRILVELDFLSEHDLFRMLAKHLDLPIVDLGMREVQPEALSMVNAEIATRYKLLPIGLKSTPTGKVLHVAMSDPTDMDALDQLQSVTGARIVPLITEPAGLHEAIAKHYGGQPSGAGADANETLAASTAPTDEADIPIVTGELLNAPPVSPPREAIEIPAPSAPVEDTPSLSAAPTAWSTQAPAPTSGDTPALDSFGAMADPAAWETPATSHAAHAACPSCHTTLVADARFCFQCGHNLSGDAPSAASSNQISPESTDSLSPSPFGPPGAQSSAPMANFSDWSADPQEDAGAGFHDPFAPTPTVSVDLPSQNSGNGPDSSAPFAHTAHIDSPAPATEELPLSWADALELPLPLALDTGDGLSAAGEDVASDSAEPIRTPPWAAIPRKAETDAAHNDDLAEQEESLTRATFEALSREDLLSLCLRLYERDAIALEDVRALRAK